MGIRVFIETAIKKRFEMRCYKSVCGFFLVLVFLSGCSHTTKPFVEKGYFSAGSNTYTVKNGDTLYSIASSLNQDFRSLAAINRIKPPYRIYPKQIIQLIEGSSMVISPDSNPNEAAFFALLQEKSEKYAVFLTPVGNPDRRSPDVGSKPVQNRKKEPPVVNRPKAVSKLQKNKNEKNTGNYQNNSVKNISNERISVNHKDSGWVMPVAGKVIRGFSSVGKLSKGIDFAAKAGSDVISTRSGKVVYAGSRLKGYGNLIIIKHDDEYLSAYAHNRSILVKEGEVIKQGQKIAEVGSSGAASPQLHFEIRQFGKPIDPLKLLKQ